MNNPEIWKILDGGFRNGYVYYSCLFRPFATPIGEIFQIFFFPCSYRLHISFRGIFYPSCNMVLTRYLLRSSSKKYSLHPARNE